VQIARALGAKHIELPKAIWKPNPIFLIGEIINGAPENAALLVGNEPHRNKTSQDVGRQLPFLA
jgi:hypothetical protein